MTMDVGKSQTRSGSRSKSSVSWLEGMRSEFKKISWTSRQELKVYTKVVIASTFVVGLGIYVLDLLARGALNAIGSLVKAIVS